MRKTVFFAVLMLILTKSYGQNLVFKYLITKDSTVHTKKNQSIGSYFLKIVRNSHDKFDPVSFQNTETSRSFFLKRPTLEVDVINYNIKGSGVYYIQDITGHEILLDPSLIKDTVQLSLYQNHYKDGPLGANRYYLNDSISASTVFNIVYPDKYKYIGFFDTLACLHDNLHSIHFGYSFKQLNHNLPKFLTGINRIYEDRMKFFKNFVQKYGMPKGLQLYAQKEIQYSYYKDLLLPLIDWDTQLYSTYPLALQDTINNFKKDINNTVLFENTPLHRLVLTQYVAVMNRGASQGPPKFDDALLNNILAYNKRMLKGPVKAYETAWLMQIYNGQGDTTAVKTLYENYEPDPASPAINKLMDSVYRSATHPGLSPQEMLNLSFENSLHADSKFSNLITKKVILIDCWATWCVPCRNQTPFLNSIAKKYNDRVQFISLAADQDVRKWDTWIKQNTGSAKEISQLYAKGGFENIFFKRFMINAIPRYMLLSASGEVLNATMPLPSDGVQFEKELNKYL